MNSRNSIEKPLWLALFLALGCTNATGVEDVASSQDGLTFEEWKAQTRFQDRAVYVVGERVAPLGLVGEEEARRYYDRKVAPARTAGGALTLDNGQKVDGDPIVGGAFPEQAELLYCIDAAGLRNVVSRHSYLPTGANLYRIIDDAFGAAAAAWNTTAGVRINKAIDRDESCSPRAGDNITWYVRPLYQKSPYEYFTFALRPKYNLAGPDNREFFVWEDLIIDFWYPDPNYAQFFTLDGLLANAIGHALGFIPESNRGGVPGDEGATIWPASCRDNMIGGIFLSIADPYSVMTHPHSLTPLLANPKCVGFREHDYAISYVDAMGSSCQYRSDNGLFYCMDLAQRQVRLAGGFDCSPVPMVAGGAGDCGTHLDYQKEAPRFVAAAIAALSN
jgi:hypothetical protein